MGPGLSLRLLVASGRAEWRWERGGLGRGEGVTATVTRPPAWRASLEASGEWVRAGRRA